MWLVGGPRGVASESTQMGVYTVSETSEGVWSSGVHSLLYTETVKAKGKGKDNRRANRIPEAGEGASPLTMDSE